MVCASNLKSIILWVTPINVKVIRFTMISPKIKTRGTTYFFEEGWVGWIKR